MEKDQKFPEQEAPVKNTDNAFVQVAKDGSALIPDKEAIAHQQEEEEKGKQDEDRH